MEDDSRTHRLSLQEAAALSGMTPTQFRDYFDTGYIDAEYEGGKYRMTDAEAYRLVTMRNPSLAMGRATLLTCGRHTFMAVHGTCSCPACGGQMTEADRTATVEHMLLSSLRRCSRCGVLMTMVRWRKICDDCQAHSRRSPNGNRRQETWDGLRHTCCGSSASWRHHEGCRSAMRHRAGRRHRE